MQDRETVKRKLFMLIGDKAFFERLRLVILYLRSNYQQWISSLHLNDTKVKVKMQIPL